MIQNVKRLIYFVSFLFIIITLVLFYFLIYYDSSILSLLIVIITIGLAIIPLLLCVLKISDFYNYIDHASKIDNNSFKKYSRLFKRLELSKYLQPIFLTLWIVVSIFHYTLTNNIVTSFVFLLVLNDFNFENFNLLILQIGMIALFFLSYGEFALLSITRHELYYYLLTKFYFLSIENTSKKYEKLKHLSKGLNYYRRFILKNFKLHIQGLNNYYYDFIQPDSQGISSLDKFIKAFKKENNELGLFEELVQFFRDKNITNYITKSSIRPHLKEWISVIIALIPLFIALLDYYSK